MTDMMICLAPTGPWGTGRNNPICPADLIQTAKACYAAGASVMHLHARDLHGNLTIDMGYLQETFAGIQKESEMIIEASTGGLSDFTPEERGLPVSVPGATLGSLNLGSLNFGDEVYSNPPPFVDTWIQQMDQAAVKPNLEIFDTGQIAFAKSLIDSGKIKAPYNFSFVFNVKWGMVFSEPLLKYLVSQLPAHSNFGTNFIGSQDFSGHVIAAENGADVVRTGFEDSTLINGKSAESNFEMVSALRKTLETNGFKIIQGELVKKKLLGI
jgi:3-keto-5-aminohexanoate cleavage enzyme